MPQDYTKPKNKTTLTVRFETGEFKYNMELPHAPRTGEIVHDPNQAEFRITKVIYKPFNEFMEDDLVLTEKLQ